MYGLTRLRSATPFDVIINSSFVPVAAVTVVGSSEVVLIDVFGCSKVSPLHRLGTNVTLRLQFRHGFLQNPDDVILLLQVGWKSLGQPRQVLRTNGGSTFTVWTNEMRGERADSTFQFVYVQNAVAVGISRPFVLEAEDTESLQDGWDFLDEESEDMENEKSRGNGRCKADHYSHEFERPSSHNERELEMFESPQAEDPDQQKPSVSERLPLEQTEAGELTAQYVASSLETVEEAGSKTSANRECSFVSVSVPVAQQISSCGSDLQALFTQSLRDRDKMYKLYYNEKEIAVKQDERNGELQKEYDNALSENRKLKLALKHIESEMERITEEKTKQQRLERILPVTATLLTGETLMYGSHAQGNLRSCSKSTQYEEEGDDPVLDLAIPGQFCSLACDFHCPVCMQKFDRKVGTTQFQRHVHSHFCDKNG